MGLKNTKEPLQGEIWLFDPDPIRGNEIEKKVRPCLIISNNYWNKMKTGLVIVVPLTSVDKKISTHVRILPQKVVWNYKALRFANRSGRLAKTG